MTNPVRSHTTLQRSAALLPPKNNKTGVRKTESCMERTEKCTNSLSMNNRAEFCLEGTENCMRKKKTDRKSAKVSFKVEKGFLHPKHKSNCFGRSGARPGLLMNLEESLLSGVVAPVSVVEGFSASIGASGSFHTRDIRLPVTVLCYDFFHNNSAATPYLASINNTNQSILPNSSLSPKS